MALHRPVRSRIVCSRFGRTITPSCGIDPDRTVCENVYLTIITQCLLSQVPPRFGLIDASDDRWAKFEAHIRQLNQDSPVGTTYKFFFLSRHGQGYRMTL